MEELDKLIESVDKTIEALSLPIPGADVIIGLFVGIVAGFDEIEKKARELAEEFQLPEEDIKTMIKKQKDAYIEQMKTAGKAFIDAKRAELVAMLSQLKAEVTEIPKSLAKAIADAAMPTMISPGAPNPASSALRLYLSLVAIKAAILMVLVLTSRILHLVKDLGLGGLSGVATIKALIEPILALKKEIEDKLDAADCAECEAATPADYKVKDPDGKEITGLDIQAKLRSWLDIQTFPLSKSSKRKVKKTVKNASDDSDDPIWGDIVLGYSDFYDKAIAK
jgi:hypothetical protein